LHHPTGGTVGVSEILSQIDRQLSQLEKARTLLKGTAPAIAPRQLKKRKLTPEGRKRIAEAVRRRWAEQKKK
jgi:hypothetical protein